MARPTLNPQNEEAEMFCRTVGTEIFEGRKHACTYESRKCQRMNHVILHVRCRSAFSVPHNVHVTYLGTSVLAPRRMNAVGFSP